MTCVRKGAFTAIVVTLIIGALMMQCGMLWQHFWACMFDDHWTKLGLSLNDLIEGDFAAACVLITFGAVLNRISPYQMLVVAFFEVFFYSLNYRICTHPTAKMGAVDMGGSMFVHTFGALFGLGASFCFGMKKWERSLEKNEGASYHNDIFSFVGTIFLWMYIWNRVGLTLIQASCSTMTSGLIQSILSTKRYRGLF
jgi:ammonium transporter Rh